MTDKKRDYEEPMSVGNAQRAVAKRLLAIKRDGFQKGMRLTDDEVYALWLAFIDYWEDLAEDQHATA